MRAGTKVPSCLKGNVGGSTQQIDSKERGPQKKRCERMRKRKEREYRQQAKSLALIVLKRVKGENARKESRLKEARD